MLRICVLVVIHLSMYLYYVERKGNIKPRIKEVAPCIQLQVYKTVNIFW